MYRTIVEESQQHVAVMDVFSKLIQERIIFIDGIIDDDLANGVIAQMLYLSAVNGDREISIYINSPGGQVTAGLAIYDVAKLIKTPIKTVCIGQAASMGCILMLMGTERCGLTHSRFMLHQVSGGVVGTFEDMKINLEEAQKAQNAIYKIIKEKTFLKSIDDELKFDKWFGSEEALEANIITKIL